MNDDQEQTKRERGAGLTWWVRYAFVPVAVALIAGASAVRAAALLKPDQESTPAVIVVPQASQPLVTAPSDSRAQVVPPTALPTALLTPDPTGAPIETPAPTQTETAAAPVPAAIPEPSEAPAATQALEATLGKHIVQRGEQLFCIGRGYGVVPAAIAQANHLENPALLRAGQVLDIPDKEWQDVPNGPVCVPQFYSPYAGRAVNLPVIPLANPAANSAPDEPKAPVADGEEPPSEAPVETAPPAEAPVETPPPYPPPGEG